MDSKPIVLKHMIYVKCNIFSLIQLLPLLFFICYLMNNYKNLLPVHRNVHIILFLDWTLYV